LELRRGRGIPNAIYFSSTKIGFEEIRNKFAKGQGAAERRRFWGWGWAQSTKRNANAARPNKHREQTNVKQINRLARHQCHHPVALDAQISEDLSKKEVRINRGLLLNETHAQNGT
jgi:hypothetical protein